MKKILLIGFTLIYSMTFAQNLVQDSYESYNSNVQLSGQGNWTNNSSLPGGLGSCVGALCANAKVIDQSTTVIGYGSSTKAFSLTPDTDGCGRAFTPFTENGNLYIAMVINITNAQSSPIDFFRVMSGANLTTTFRMLVQPTSGTTFSIGIRKGDTTNPTAYTANSYNYGTSYLLIFKYSQLAGANDDTVTLYANANYAAGEAGNTISATNFAGNDQSGSIDRMSFRQNAGPAGMPTGYVSLVSVAKTWDSLTFNLANDTFSKNTFTIVGNKAANGILNIKSGVVLNNATLTIYDIQGKLVANKTIALQESINEITINPITSAGVYVVEITSEDNQRFAQKIILK